IKKLDYYVPHLNHLFNEEWIKKLDLKKTLFVDLETTGLAGGTGTFAFLIGLGYIELDHIIVRQYLLPDFQYEWLLLKHVENMLISYKYIASFNGKSFDIPLLRNRFVLNRMDSVLDEIPHIDILHGARRLWKRRLSSCDLGNLEYMILGEERINDIPGELIPQLYFEYIRKRQALLLRDVLEHNYHDITNLILLTLHMSRVMDNPMELLNDTADLYSVAYYLYRNQKFPESLPILEYLHQNGQDPMIKQEALFLLSMTHKKTGDFLASQKYFQLLLQDQKDHPEALEELAKYYEHHDKNFQAALDLVDQGIEYCEILEQLGKEAPILRKKDDLYHRRNRLNQKILKVKDVDSS
ncbi:MAG: ribonuclease H-like domain-containing protein, partial [bacterium]